MFGSLAGEFPAQLDYDFPGLNRHRRNPFDITGARAAGLRAIWVDRSGSGWVDQLAPQGLELGPNQIVRGLDKIPELIRQFA